MHRRELRVRRLGHEDVEALRLVDERAAVGRHVDERTHLHLPRRAVERLEVGRDLRDALHRAIVGDDLIPDLGRPEITAHQIAQQVLVDNGEFAREHAARVEVGRVRLEALVVAEDLRRRGGGHRRDEQRVAQAVGSDRRAQARPVPAIRRRDSPQVKLQLATRGGAALPRRVTPELLGELARRLERGVVDSLEDVAVESARLVRLKRQPQPREDISQALHTNPDRPVAQVGRRGLRQRVVRHGDHAVERARDHPRDAPQRLVIETQRAAASAAASAAALAAALATTPIAASTIALATAAAIAHRATALAAAALTWLLRAACSAALAACVAAAIASSSMPITTPAIATSLCAATVSTPTLTAATTVASSTSAATAT
mmetsp:Transcript_14943/g.44735  ORF Transcript_14943/g.44735 Transcript_14943/m.44735 type:complete len:376 (+) Transcript_14943:584-1711(+)